VRRTRRWSVALLGLAIAASGARAEDPAAIAARAGSADLAALAALEERLASHAAANASPEALAASGEALGALVARAQELRAGAATHARLATLAMRLGDGVASARKRLEARAGEDEAALEQLYRSSDWQRLDYAAVTLGYWRGWAELSRGQALDAGAERREAMRRAVAAFEHSARELRLPGIAAASLLGLGMSWRDLGELERARGALERLRAQLARQPDAKLQLACDYELVAIALAQGDAERAGELAAALPAGALTPEQQSTLVRAELESWLSRAEQDPEALERAALRLRELLAAGGPSAQAAAALVQQHWPRLRGRELGTLGELLGAEDAFAAGRFAEARDGYRRALSAPGGVPGLDERTARYKLAVSLAQTGERSAAASELEQLLPQLKGHPVRAPAARLYQQLAEALLAEQPGAAAEARAERAAALLLEAAPDAAGADVARYRVALAGKEKKPEDAIRELSRIPPESPVYAASRLELARRRAERFEQLDAAGGDAKRLRVEAQALAHALDLVGELVEAGRIPADPARDSTLAVLRAKASLRAGDPPDRVRSWLRRAEVMPGLDAAAQRALLRVQLQTQLAAGDLDALAAALAERSDDQLRREWPIWYEAAAAAAEREPASAALLAGWVRLERAAPAESRDAFALAHARALLRAGQAEEATRRARALTERDASWGDAWVLYAQAEDARGDAGAARRAWEHVAAGLERGSPRWAEAELAAGEAALRAGDAKAACEAATALRASGGAPATKAGERIRSLEKSCAAVP
jgi:chemotaxis protein histidine kinase CheA